MNQVNREVFWVWTFKFYDTQLKKWCKSNCPDLHSLERYRRTLMNNKRYSNIGNCYQRDIANPLQY